MEHVLLEEGFVGSPGQDGFEVIPPETLVEVLFMYQYLLSTGLYPALIGDGVVEEALLTTPPGHVLLTPDAILIETRQFQ